MLFSSIFGPEGREFHKRVIGAEHKALPFQFITCQERVMQVMHVVRVRGGIVPGGYMNEGVRLGASCHGRYTTDAAWCDFCF